MSRINAAVLKKAPVEFRPELQKVRQWINKRKHVDFIDPGQIYREIEGIDLVKLALSLHYLTENDCLRQVYRVQAPNGAYVDGDYESPAEIPSSVTDQFRGKKIGNQQANIVTGFLVEGHSGNGKH